MKLIILGGDRVSYNLVRLLREQALELVEREIVVIEQDTRVATRLADELGVSVVIGDGCSQAVLAEAGCEDADMVVALMGRDENNLVACQLAKFVFQVPTTLAKLNNPKNRAAFELYGVDQLYSGTELLANAIDQEVEFRGLQIIYNLPDNSKVIIAFTLSAASYAVGQNLAELELPGEAKLVLVTRADGTVEMPSGHLILKAEDRVMMICDTKELSEIWQRLIQPNALDNPRR